MKIARVRDSNNTETYALISSDEKKLVTRNEIQEQTGIPIPSIKNSCLTVSWKSGEFDKPTYSHM
jgi:hypothetical protein